MISIQVSVQQHSATALPSLIQAHIKLGRRNCGLAPSTPLSPPAEPNSPLIPEEPMGKLPSLVDPSFASLALDQSLLAIAGLKRSSFSSDCSENWHLSPPPTKKARTVDLESSPCLPSPSQSPSPKKTVHFSNGDDLEEIIPNGAAQEDYDCEARWYSRSEYNAFRQDMKMNFFTHSMYMRRNSLGGKDALAARPPKDLCIRGLEKFCFYSNHEAVVKDTRKLRQQAVLDQQGIQKALGVDDPMAIRVVAELHSQKVCEQALERAADDYRAVLYGWSRKSI